MIGIQTHIPTEVHFDFLGMTIPVHWDYHAILMVAVWFVLDLVRARQVTAIGAATAIVVGCVGITPAAGYISPGWAPTYQRIGGGRHWAGPRHCRAVGYGTSWLIRVDQLPSAARPPGP